jgi:hypothetical protein
MKTYMDVPEARKGYGSELYMHVIVGLASLGTSVMAHERPSHILKRNHASKL